MHPLNTKSDFKEERNYYRRFIFLEICQVILTTFSKKFFRDHFVHHYLGLSRDPVANIRLKFIELLPLVRKTIRMPTDSQLLQKLFDATEPLLARDSDSDVMLAMSQMLARFGPLDGDGFGDRTYMPHSKLSLKDEELVPYSKNKTAMLSIARDSDDHLKKIDSKSSITDEYFFKHPEASHMGSDTIDKAREDEEKRLMFDQINTEWVVKRRDLYDQKDHHRKPGERERKSLIPILKGKDLQSAVSLASTSSTSSSTSSASSNQSKATLAAPSAPKKRLSMTPVVVVSSGPQTQALKSEGTSSPVMQRARSIKGDNTNSFEKVASAGKTRTKQAPSAPRKSFDELANGSTGLNAFSEVRNANQDVRKAEEEIQNNTANLNLSKIGSTNNPIGVSLPKVNAKVVASRQSSISSRNTDLPR